MRTALIPPDAGLLSALGLGAAAFERFAERDVLAPLSDAGPVISTWIEELAQEARSRLLSEGCPPEAITWQLVLANVRLQGQATSLAVTVGEPASPQDLATEFHRLYRERYGYAAEDRPIEIESIRVAVSTEPGLKRPAWHDPGSIAFDQFDGGPHVVDFVARGIPISTAAPLPLVAARLHGRIRRRPNGALAVPRS